MIAVYDFMNLCIDDDQIYTIYDFSKGDVVFTGTIRELPDELDNYNVVSFDSTLKCQAKRVDFVFAPWRDW